MIARLLQSKAADEGFTLVEMLITIVVTSIVIMLLSNYLLSNIETSNLAGIKANFIQQSQIGLNLINNDIRQSSNSLQHNSWPDPNSPQGTTNEYSWSSTSSSLVLAIPAEDTNGNIIFSDADSYVPVDNNIVYFIQNGVLYKRIIAAQVTNNAQQSTCPPALANSTCPPDKIVLKNVSNFYVMYLDGRGQNVKPSAARSIKLDITVSKKMYSQTLSTSYITQMVFRNG